MPNVKPIPEGHHTITASLIVKGGKKAIEFYKAAFGAQELGVMLGPNGQSVMHAELKIGDSIIFVGDEMPEMGMSSPQTLGGSPVSLHIYTEDCDALFNRAVAAGATVKMPVADMFWGDRAARQGSDGGDGVEEIAASGNQQRAGGLAVRGRPPPCAVDRSAADSTPARVSPPTDPGRGRGFDAGPMFRPPSPLPRRPRRRPAGRRRPPRGPER